MFHKIASSLRWKDQFSLAMTDRATRRKMKIYRIKFVHSVAKEVQWSRNFDMTYMTTLNPKDVIPHAKRLMALKDPWEKERKIIPQFPETLGIHTQTEKYAC